MGKLTVSVKAQFTITIRTAYFNMSLFISAWKECLSETPPFVTNLLRSGQKLYQIILMLLRCIPPTNTSHCSNVVAMLQQGCWEVAAKLLQRYNNVDVMLSKACCKVARRLQGGCSNVAATLLGGYWKLCSNLAATLKQRCWEVATMLQSNFSINLVATL